MSDLTGRCLATEMAKAQFVTKTYVPAPGAQELLGQARESLAEKKSSVSRMALVKSSNVRADFEDYMAANINLDDDEPEEEEQEEEQRAPAPPKDSSQSRFPRKPRRGGSMDLPTAPQRDLLAPQESAGMDPSLLSKASRRFSFLSGLTIARGACDDPDEDAEMIAAAGHRTNSTLTFMGDNKEESRTGKALDMLRSIDPKRRNSTLVAVGDTKVFPDDMSAPVMPMYGRRASMVIMPVSRQDSDLGTSPVGSLTEVKSSLSASNSLYMSSGLYSPSPTAALSPTSRHTGFLQREISSEAGVAPPKTAGRPRGGAVMSTSGAASPVPSLGGGAKDNPRPMMGRSRASFSMQPMTPRTASQDFSKPAEAVNIKRSGTGGLDVKAGLASSLGNLSASGPLTPQSYTGAALQPQTSTSGVLPRLSTASSGTASPRVPSKSVGSRSQLASGDETPANLFGRLKDIFNM